MEQVQGKNTKLKLAEKIRHAFIEDLPMLIKIAIYS